MKNTYNKSIVERLQYKNLYKFLKELIVSNSDVYYITCDGLTKGSTLRNLKETFPNRILDVGIAEQNAVNIAVGLSLSGKTAVLLTTSSFLTMRAFEQIHSGIAHNNASVKLLGIDSGTISNSGPTHDSICDLSILNSIPNMTIIVPSDMNSFINILKNTVMLNKPIYYRVPKDNFNKLYDNSTNVLNRNGANVLKKGTSGTIIATGRCVQYALQAAICLSSEGIEIQVVDLYLIKPINSKFITMLSNNSPFILTVEDHNINGGMGTLISNIVQKSNVNCKIIQLGIPDEFAKIGPSNKVLSYYNMDTEGICKTIREYIHGIQ